MDNVHNKKKYNKNAKCRKQVSINNKQHRLQKIQEEGDVYRQRMNAFHKCGEKNINYQIQ